MGKEEKDLCKTCGHYWLDFPMPLDEYIGHCEILDRMPSLLRGSKGNAMDEIVPYPCLECPFNSYIKKEGKSS